MVRADNLLKPVTDSGWAAPNKYVTCSTKLWAPPLVMQTTKWTVNYSFYDLKTIHSTKGFMLGLKVPSEWVSIVIALPKINYSWLTSVICVFTTYVWSCTALNIKLLKVNRYINSLKVLNFLLLKELKCPFGCKPNMKNIVCWIINAVGSTSHAKVQSLITYTVDHRFLKFRSELNFRIIWPALYQVVMFTNEH